MLLEEEFLRFRIDEVTFGSLAFEYIIMLLDCYLVLIVVVLALVMLLILFRIVFC